MNNHLLAVTLLLLLSACVTSPHHPPLRLRQVMRSDNGVLQKKVYDYTDAPGRERVEIYYPNGRLQEVYYRQNGHLNGLRTVFFENGTLSEMGNWRNDVREGIFRYYTSNGRLDCERYFGLLSQQ